MPKKKNKTRKIRKEDKTLIGFDNIPKTMKTIWAIDQFGKRKVVDIEKNKGRGAVMGDGMALKHKALGAVGVINGGSIRDLPGIAAAEMPVWATGRVPGHGPFNLIETQTDVEVGDLVIKPGDLIIGDSDGITRIPMDLAELTLKKCKEVREFETKIFEELKKKISSIKEK